ncbi:MAG: M56 family metallopeptidase [Sphingomicrobium sp.]
MIDWLIDSAASVSLLVLLVLVLRGPVARQFGARAAYALWLAPLSRLIVPPVGAWATLNEGSIPVAIGGGMPEIVIARAPAAAGFDALPWVLALWVAGAVIYLAVQLVRHHLFLHRALRHGTTLDLPGVPYDVVASDAVAGPMATGLVHPLILVPADFTARFTPEQQRLALLHEQLHHRRGDIWASAAALVLTALLWFNPFAHLALGAFRRDMESACDSAVLAAVQPDESPLYAETILRSAIRPVPRSLCALTSLDELKGRLTMLTRTHGRGRKLAGFGIAAGLTATGLAFTVPAAAEPQEEHEIVRKVVIKGADGKEVITESKESDALIARPDCKGEKVEIVSEGGAGAGKKEAIKIVLCGKAGESGAQRADELAKALSRMESDSDLDAETKADLKAKMEAKIRELRARG